MGKPLEYPNTDNIALTTFNQDLNLLDSNNDRTSTAADVMVGAGGNTSEAANSPVEFISNDELSTASHEQTAKDTGSAAAIKPLTDLMDFKINISDTSQHGTIQSVSFKLSATESNLIYYKLDSDTNTYYVNLITTRLPEKAHVLLNQMNLLVTTTS